MPTPQKSCTWTHNLLTQVQEGHLLRNKEKIKPWGHKNTMCLKCVMVQIQAASLLLKTHQLCRGDGVLAFQWKWGSLVIPTATVCWVELQGFLPPEEWITGRPTSVTTLQKYVSNSELLIRSTMSQHFLTVRGLAQRDSGQEMQWCRMMTRGLTFGGDKQEGNCWVCFRGKNACL